MPVAFAYRPALQFKHCDAFTPYWPTLQAVHADAFPDDTVPLRHTVQFVVPAVPENVPTGHARHPVPDCEYCPGEHCTAHDVAVASLVLPAPHGRHTAAPDDGAYQPSAHRLHAAPIVENWPATHAEQLAAPGLVVDVPLAHTLQVADDALLYCPMAHGLHAAPIVENCPAVQAVQEAAPAALDVPLAHDVHALPAAAY